MPLLILDEITIAELIKYYADKEGIQNVVNNTKDIEKYNVIIVDPYNYNIKPYLDKITKSDIIIFSSKKPNFNYTKFINKPNLKKIKEVIKNYK